MPRSLLIAAALTLTVFAFVACSDNGKSNTNQNTPAGTAATQPAATQPAGTPGVATPTPLISIATTESPANAVFGRNPIDKPATATTNTKLTTAQSGTFDEYDRMTFQFDSGLPSYQIQYVTAPALACASGQDAQLQGNALLQIRFSPAVAHDDTGNASIPSTDLTPALPALLEAKRTCDFEGVVTWVLGLSAEVDYRVFVIGDSLLVVDVHHP